MSVPHLVLDNHANGLEDSPMFLNTVAEALSEDIELLEAPPVEGLVASPNSFLELFHRIGIVCASNTDLRLLAAVPAVSNHLFADGDLALQSALFIDVGLPSWEATVDPSELIFGNRDTKLVCDASLTELRRAPC